ncbi:MAG: hypothetical protein NTW80_07080 [Deltaproteobacteria bacterium]|nr:hypothetical protein [Deltaproteobacteria bacterium]
MHQGCGAQTLRPGTEVFAVDSSRVIEVAYRSPALVLIAHRWEMGGKFTLVCLEKKQNRPSSCLAGPSFDLVLRQLTSLKLRRTLTARQAEDYWRKNPRPAWAEVVIRDHSELEPFQALVRPMEGSPQEAVVRFNGATYIVALDHQVFELIAGGCKTLGAGDESLGTRGKLP